MARFKIQYFLRFVPCIFRETLIKSFDKLRTNGNLLILFVVSLSNHERSRINQRILREPLIYSQLTPQVGV